MLGRHKHSRQFVDAVPNLLLPTTHCGRLSCPAGTPYSDPLGVYHMRPVNNCTTVSDVVAALGQVMHGCVLSSFMTATI